VIAKARLSTYFVARWGSVPEGADGPDTNFLVAARTVEEAGQLADKCLRGYPVHNGPNVRNFVSLVMRLGTSATKNPTVIHGPWVSHAIVRGFRDQEVWGRDRARGPWVCLPRNF
jgi:hypothetical protein